MDTAFTIDRTTGAVRDLDTPDPFEKPRGLMTIRVSPGKTVGEWWGCRGCGATTRGPSCTRCGWLYPGDPPERIKRGIIRGSLEMMLNVAAPPERSGEPTAAEILDDAGVDEWDELMEGQEPFPPGPTAAEQAAAERGRR